MSCSGSRLISQSLKYPFLAYTPTEMTVIERIEREYHRNHSQPEAFHNICPDLGYTPIPGMSVIQTWFERFNQGDDYLINEMEGKYWVCTVFGL